MSLSRRRIVALIGCLVLLGWGAAAAADSSSSSSAPDPEMAATPSVSRWAAPSLSASQRQEIITAHHAETIRGVKVKQGFLTMSDGVRLAVTYLLPRPLRAGEKLPVVLSATPYRKDDQVLTVDYHLFHYFAERGIAVAIEDVRGSGSSDGQMIDREYSDAELDDLEGSVAQLAAKPWSNGNVGMMGYSWSGFNTIMTAMRRPPALKAILIAHSSEDLYRNDIHYIDGILHYDLWALQMEADTIAPQFPDYELDDAYFQDRFDRTPWTMQYLQHQRDGDWWQQGRSLQSDWDSLDIPVYAIGGLQDGYRDYIVNLLDNAHVPVWAEVGPWAHYWPNVGWPPPKYEFRQTAVRWWQRWLTDDTSWPFEGKTLTLYQRDAVRPNRTWWWTSPGSFHVYDWPINDVREVRFVPQADHSLTKAGAGGTLEATHELQYVPSRGIEVGPWWGDIRGDTTPADRDALIYTSPELSHPLRMLGNAQVQLAVSADVDTANWIVRLEDRWPDGDVTLVTGAAINGTQRASTTDPQPLPVGDDVVLHIPLHFMAYTFPTGHRLRLVVTNAQFPMLWPSAQNMTTTLNVGEGPILSSFMDVPTVGPAKEVTMPHPIEKAEPIPGAKWLYYKLAGPYKIIEDDPKGITRVSETESGTLSLNGTLIHYLSTDERWVDNTDPSKAGIEGTSSEVYTLPDRTVTVRATIELRSDADSFYVTITREALEDDELIRTRVFSDQFPRDSQ